MRKPIIAGNWKMNKTPSEARELVTALAPLVKDAVRAYVRWQHDFCGRGEGWKTCFADIRDAMGLSDDYREAPASGGAGGACCDL